MSVQKREACTRGQGSYPAACCRRHLSRSRGRGSTTVALIPDRPR
jgi:hypothetical protein